jgi:beta-1,4-N-acetylglucosaminyltransferase
MSKILLYINVLFECKILFIESFCRTFGLSLSGKLIKPISDRFIVLWSSLAEKGLGEYVGKII